MHGFFFLSVHTLTLPAPLRSHLFNKENVVEIHHDIKQSSHLFLPIAISSFISKGPISLFTHTSKTVMGIYSLLGDGFLGMPVGGVSWLHELL